MHTGLHAVVRAIAISFAFACNVFAEPPPPPPPPPPSDLPATLDGYSTAHIWSSYVLWVGQRIGEARALAIDVAPLPDSMGPDFIRSLDGPRVRSFIPEQGGDLYGADARLDRWCRHPRNQQPDCVWLGRVARSDSATHIPFVREHFDLESAVRFLRDTGVAPETLERWTAQSFGLPDPLDYGPLQYVVLKQATEGECANVAVALENARQAQERLVASRNAPRNGRPIGPPPPHAGSMEITFPGWFVRDRESNDVSNVDLVVRGHGPGILVTSLARSIFEPLDMCPQAELPK